jgi:cation diffusion facilitator family transporter
MASVTPSTELRPLALTIGLYGVLLALKLAVYAATGLMALLGEALHTLSDIFVYGFLLVAILCARRPADAEHAFGHGRAQSVAALVAATLFVSFTSLRLFEEAIPRLFAAEPPAYRNVELGLAVVIVSMAAVAAPLVLVLRQGQRGPAAKAQLLELVNDELGLVAALAGTLGVLAGWSIADPIATLAVATIIAVDGAALFRENLSLLLGRSPGPEYLARLERQAMAVEGVLGVHDVRAEYVGPEAVHAGLHVEVRPDLTVAEAARIADEVSRRLHDGADPGHCVVRVEPLGAHARAAVERS